MPKKHNIMNQKIDISKEFLKLKLLPLELELERVVGMIHRLPTMKPKTRFDQIWKTIRLNQVLLISITAMIIMGTIVKINKVNSSFKEPDRDNIAPLTQSDSTGIHQSEGFGVDDRDGNRSIPSDTLSDKENATSQAKDKDTSDKTKPNDKGKSNKGNGGFHNYTFDTYQQVFRISDKPVKEGQLINLNTSKLRAIKKELMHTLRDYGIEINRKEVLEISIEQFDVIAINETLAGDALQLKLNEILLPFKVEPSPKRKILLSKSFIIIGDFGDEFRGSAQGNITKIDSEINKSKWKN